MKKKVRHLRASATFNRQLYETNDYVRTYMEKQIGLNVGNILLKIRMNYQLGLEKLKMNIV